MIPMRPLVANRNGVVWLCVLAALTLTGCGSSGRPTAKVRGMVEYKGKPVPGGRVYLSFPDKTEVQIAISGNGSFFSSNLAPGKVQVAIETESLLSNTDPHRDPRVKERILNMARNLKPEQRTEIEKQVNKNMGDADGTAPRYRAIPTKYGRYETANLTWEIQPGDNFRKFVLED